MSVTVRKTPVGGRHELDRITAILNSRQLLSYPNVGNGTTAGKLRTNATTVGRIGGLMISKASADDLWAFAAEAALTAGQYRGYWLAIDVSGAAIAVASTRGTVQTTQALAKANLPAIDLSWLIVGVYIAGTAGATDFTAALVAQGAVFNGIPDGCGLVASAGFDSSGIPIAGIADAINLINP
jgi:hypothetical protein